jgi:uncharacterized protein (TIGR02996 family)
VTDTALDAIHAQVLAEPDCDLHRLAWADRFEELYGAPGPRAEFVRAQCELATRRRCPSCCDVRSCVEIRSGGLTGFHEGNWCRKHADLRRRERELWCDLAHVFAAELPGRRFNMGLTPDDASQSPVREWAFVRRGWPSAVTLPLAAWVGTDCGRCNGGFVWEEYRGGAEGKETRRREVRCSNGTPALGPLIAASCPLWPEGEAVRLSDREPVQSASGWWWSSPRAVRTYPRSILPEPLFRALQDGVCDGKVSTFVLSRSFATAKDSLTALSKAALAWAKSQIRI